MLAQPKLPKSAVKTWKARSIGASTIDVCAIVGYSVLIALLLGSTTVL